ncbi:AfsR/SARP family transcriptional regulator [Streptomyces halobius]|uniref:AfsR/SARP family transcriptional regulator n=1 Tax=Streptomyces halobius TaxID=2879846 RepID=A0ABY4M3Z1_9ACTN|nr:AfsR/SARP family transcriptional regulator [Streptomyces halobius]UQA92487.1 AfsR/SARP family transcriptional regulator [Streptomyces halobius]
MKPRVVLANLLVRPDQAVSSLQLMEELWDGCPPRTAGTALQVYVSNLRKLLDKGGFRAGHATIVTQPPGYALRMAGHDGDMNQFAFFRRQADALQGKGDLESASECLRAGLALWRGSALADVRVTPRLIRAADYLDELRMTTQEKKIELELMLGRHVGLVGELYALAAQFSARERVHELLMVALYNSGRPADALRVYLSLRRNLNDMSGLDPSARLQRLQRAILAQKLEYLPVPQAQFTPHQPLHGQLGSRDVAAAQVLHHA